MENSTTEVPLALVREGDNVRPLDQEHVDNLTGSMKLIGMIQPLTVRSDGNDGYLLTAGYHRLAAAKAAGLPVVPIHLREDETEPETDAAVENIARKDLTPAEEAAALKAMLDKGLSYDGAAQALGWPLRRVTARVKLLELPDAVQKLVGVSEPMAIVEPLLEIREVSRPLFDAMCQALIDGSMNGDQVVNNTTWACGRVIYEAMEAGSKELWGAYLSSISGAEHKWADAQLGVKLRKKAREQVTTMLGWYEKGYESLRVSFRSGQIDAARAAGVLIESERDYSGPLCIDQKVYRELLHDAIAQRFAEGPPRKEKAKREPGAAKVERTPTDEARVQHNAAQRELAREAHGVNLDLGTALVTGLSTVEVDMDVARFFAYAALGSDWDDSPYTQSGERVMTLAACGVRLVIEQFRDVTTPTLKSGKPGKTKITYGVKDDPAWRDEPLKWLWKFVDGAKTPEELFGRTLVVIAMQRYAFQIVLTQAQRSHALYWGSHNGIAEKKLDRLCRKHLPASWKTLQKALAEQLTEHRGRLAQIETDARKQRDAEAAERPDVPEDESVGDVTDLDGGDPDDLAIEAEALDADEGLAA